MSINKFFQNKGPFTLSKIASHIESNDSIKKDIEVYDIKDIVSAGSKDITFLNSNKYKKDSLKTNALVCITKDDLTKFLPDKCIKIIVKG